MTRTTTVAGVRDGLRPTSTQLLPTAAAPSRRAGVPASQQRVLRPATAHFPALPGVDLPTQLPEPPHPGGRARLGAAPPRCAPLGIPRHRQRSGQRRAGNRRPSTVWSCVPGAVAAGGRDRGCRRPAGMLAVHRGARSFRLTGPLAALIHAAAIGVPMLLRAALAYDLPPARGRPGAIGSVLAAPAIRGVHPGRAYPMAGDRADHGCRCSRVLLTCSCWSAR